MFNPHKSNEINLQKTVKKYEKSSHASDLHCTFKMQNKTDWNRPQNGTFFPIFGESRTSQNNIPALSEWSLGARVIDIITTAGNFISPNSHAKNAQVQPSSLQYSALKVQFKRSFIDTYSNANKKKNSWQ